MKGTVYIVQEPVRRNRDSGQLEPVFDLTPAAVYGDLKVLLPPGNVMLSTAPMVAKLRHELRNFNDEDYLLLTGDPNAIGTAASIASRNNRGRFQSLKWDKRARQYIAMQIDIGG